MDATQRLAELRAHDGPIAVAALFDLFDSLAAVDVAALFGDWRGGLLPTGHPGEVQLGKLRWVGKRFGDEDDVDPIISRGADGARVANPILGAASLRVILYRGVATATMVYDNHPIFDHFRRVDDDTVIGVMERKGDRGPLFFFLERIAEAAR
jgi:hypothetical protein